MKVKEIYRVASDHRGVFHKNDIRLETHEEKTQEFVVKLLIGNREIRRMIIIAKSGKVLDFYKK